MPPCFNWDVRRLEGKRFYHPDPDHNSKWQTQVQLWETQDGRLVGAVNHESPGDAHLQIHPDFRYLEEEMIAWAEEDLGRAGGERTAASDRDGRLRIRCATTAPA